MSYTATRQASVTPVVTASSAYTAGNVVGGIMKFAGVLGAQQTGLVQSAEVTVKDTVTGELDLYLFSASPAGTFGDKGAPAIAAADVALVMGRIAMASPLSELGSNFTLYEANGINKAVAPGVKDLYGVLICKGTPTFAAVGDVTVTLVTRPDV